MSSLRSISKKAISFAFDTLLDKRSRCNELARPQYSGDYKSIIDGIGLATKALDRYQSDDTRRLPHLSKRTGRKNQKRLIQRHAQEIPAKRIFSSISSYGRMVLGHRKSKIYPFFRFKILKANRIVSRERIQIAASVLKLADR